MRTMRKDLSHDRLLAKNLSYYFAYGGRMDRVARRFGLSEERAAQIIREWGDRFPALQGGATEPGRPSGTGDRRHGDLDEGCVQTLEGCLGSAAMLRFPEHRSQREGCLKLVGPNDPILHTICRGFFTVTREDIEEMFALMQRYGGLGLAAPQVGINAQLFVAHWGEVFVNPVILEGVFSYPAEEGCLSLPGVVKRVLPLQDGSHCSAAGPTRGKRPKSFSTRSTTSTASLSLTGDSHDQLGWIIAGGAAASGVRRHVLELHQGPRGASLPAA